MHICLPRLMGISALKTVFSNIENSLRNLQNPLEKHEVTRYVFVNISKHIQYFLKCIFAKDTGLLQSKTRFLYDMTVNYLKMQILSIQSRTNPLCLSSLKGWVRGSAFSADGFLIPTPQIRYMYNGVL